MFPENKKNLPSEHNPEELDLTNRLHITLHKMLDVTDEEERAAVIAQSKLDDPDWISGWLDNNEKYLLPESIDFLRTVIESKRERLEDSVVDRGPAPKSEAARIAARERVEAEADFIEAAIVTGIGESAPVEEIQQWLDNMSSEISEASILYLKLSIEFKIP